MSNPQHAVQALWSGVGLPMAALRRLSLSGADPVLPSSFAVGTAAQATLAAAALAATQLGELRNGLSQCIQVDMRHAALECCGHFLLDGREPPLWDPLSGLYPCGSGEDTGWVRLHTNFAHHRAGLLRLLGLDPAVSISRDAVTAALQRWQPVAFEDAAAAAGMVACAVRSLDEWDAHPQAPAVASLPLVSIERLGSAGQAPRTLPPLPLSSRPLSGVKVLDLTRILAGPVAGRTLAAYGAEVMLVNSPHLPNIEAIADTSRGKLSAVADIRTASGRAALVAALGETHVFVQGYRPGALAALGFGADNLASMRPGIVVVSLSAYGEHGPWAGRRGFDSLVQGATGLNRAEAQACGSAAPKAFPMQILDMASGFLMAFGAQAALWRQQNEGGSWHVRVSLARTALWLRQLGRVRNGHEATGPDFSGLLETRPSGFGPLTALRHAAQFSHTAAGWSLPSMPPGSHSLVWPEI